MIQSLRSGQMLEALNQSLKNADGAHFAVAFLSSGGLNLINDGLNTLLDGGHPFEIVVGLDGLGTEAKAVYYLYEVSQSESRLKLYCYQAGRNLFHPKLYITHHNHDTQCIVGSSNLTRGGLVGNIEFNLLFRAQNSSNEIADIIENFEWFKKLGSVFEPDENVLNLYDKVYSQTRATKPTSIIDATSELSVAIKALQTPEIDMQQRPQELSGWTGLVYDYIEQYIPNGNFFTSDLYQFEEEFRERYPENQHIVEKIRQQLQILTQKGYIIDAGMGVWVKPEKR